MGNWLAGFLGRFTREGKRIEEERDREARNMAAMAAQRRVEILEKERSERPPQEVPDRPRAAAQAPYRRRGSNVLQWRVGR
ncbi:hypothetical protein SUGI_0725160 [Cryptomeria japonica]|nr:hypothetical protein SUGI_0725160 [Cryptomeria japonica]